VATIPGLPALTAPDPDDLLVIHDDDAGEDRKITLASLFGLNSEVKSGHEAAFSVVDAQSNNLDFGIAWKVAFLMCWSSTPGSDAGTVIMIHRDQSIADIRVRAILATNGGAGVRVENLTATGVDIQNYSTSSNFDLSLVWVAIS
jgi:hypothetical protein